MPTIEVPAKDSVAMFREIREKLYEETKHMTWEEREDYYQKGVDSFRQLRQEVNLEDCPYDFSFLAKKPGQVTV